MAYVQLVDALMVGGANGGTTVAVDTTGATFIALVVTDYIAGGNYPAVVSDSKSNTWVHQSSIAPGTFGGIDDCRIHYCFSPIVGSGHTFTVAGTGQFASIGGVAFSGSAGAFDQQMGDNDSGTTGKPVNAPNPSLTPGANNCLLICAAATGTDGTLSIDSGFTLSSRIGHTANNFGTLLAWKIQTTAAAVNPTVTSDIGTGLNVVMASFTLGTDALLIDVAD